MIVKDGVFVWVGLGDIRRGRRSSYALKMFLSLTILRKKGVSRTIHRQSGRHFDIENVRSSNPTAFV